MKKKLLLPKQKKTGTHELISEQQLEKTYKFEIDNNM